MPESLDVLKLRVLLCFLNEEPKTCTVTGLAGVLGEGKQKVSRMLMALIRSSEQRYRAKYELRRQSEFGGAELCRRLGDGEYCFPFLIYREYVSGGTNLSMANEAFSHPCTLAVANGIGVVRLHPVDLSARSQMTGREMNGRVRRLMYLDGSTFAPAYDDGRAISFPARTLHFLNIGSGVGQILHGSVCLRMQCSVGTKHMPESTAIFTILI